jgi:hypothetical protein
MAKWISGEELLTRWGIPSVRLIEHVMCGDLEPHNKKRRRYEPDVLSFTHANVEPRNVTVLYKRDGPRSFSPENEEEAREKLEFWLRLLRLSMYKMEEVLLTERKGRPELTEYVQTFIDWAAHQTPDVPKQEEATARQLGDTWVIELGQELATCNLGGMKYIAHLLEHPGQRFKLLDLAEVLESVTPVRGDMGDEFDHQTRKKITARYHELRGDIEEAEREGNAYLAQKSLEELDQLVRSLHKTLSPQQVRGILGKPGGTTRAQDPSVKKEKKRIRKLLNDAYKKIGRTSPTLEKHLRRSITSVRDAGIAYNPDPSEGVSPNISQAA